MITLNCLLRGESFQSSLFIDIDEGRYIGHLKEMIKEKKRALREVDLGNIGLYNVATPMGDISALEEAYHRIQQGDIGALKPWGVVGDVVDGLGTMCLHIFVVVQDIAHPEVRPRLGRWKASSISPTPSHENLCSVQQFKQNCEKLHRLLWRKVKQLQDMVITDKDVYVAEFPVDGLSLAEKETFKMLSLDPAITQFLRRNPGETGSEWRDLLPCRSNRLIFRTAYHELVQCLRAQDSENGYSRANDRPSSRHRLHKEFIITGHPGTGKTWFLSALLVSRLLHGAKTIFQVGLSGVYRHLLFDNTGVHYLDELDENHALEVYRDVRVWALADQRLEGELRDLAHHEWLVVLTSPPKPENYMRLEKERSPPKYFMEPWSWREIMAAWSHFVWGNSRCIHDEKRTLWGSFYKYGPSRKFLIDFLIPVIRAGPAKLRNTIAEYERGLLSMLTEFLRGDLDIFTFSHSGSNDPHTTILLQPLIKPNGTYRLIPEIDTLRIITPWIGMQLGRLSGAHMGSKGKQLLELWSSHPNTSTAAGWVFEGRAHGVFSMGGKFHCNCLTANYDLRQAYNAFCSRSSAQGAPRSRAAALDAALQGNFMVDLEKYEAQTATFSDVKELAAKLRLQPRSQRFNREMRGIYLQRSYSNSGAIDSLAITVDNHDQPQAIFFQITAAESRPLAARELRAFWDALPDEVRLVPPAIVFVVPLALEPGYKVQRIDGMGYFYKRDDGPNHWPQFVIGLGDERLWGVEE